MIPQFVTEKEFDQILAGFLNMRFYGFLCAYAERSGTDLKTLITMSKEILSEAGIDQLELIHKADDVDAETMRSFDL